MRISKLTAKQFRRFSDLEIRNLPETAKLVFLCGPNGSGKSSLLDAMNYFYRQRAGNLGIDDTEYRVKKLSAQDEQALYPPVAMNTPQGPQLMPVPRQPGAVNIEFYGQKQVSQTSFYFRTAYRNDADFRAQGISALPAIELETRFQRMIDNDAAVSIAYQRLVAQSVGDLWGKSNDTFSGYRERILGRVSRAVQELFPDLILTGIGNPLAQGTFIFDKGKSQGFLYKNLSGGEKSAFDLILDLIIKETVWTDSVFGIDEPEAHLNSRVHGEMLSVLVRSISDSSQLWIASHSAGMMRRARDLYAEDASKVAFLDFEGADFDSKVVLEPIKPDRSLWRRALKVAIDDIGDLVHPSKVVLCEGENSPKSLDADCYNQVFAVEFPETIFVPAGSSSENKRDHRGFAFLLSKVTPGAAVTRLIDRDDHSEAEVQALEAGGVVCLERRNIESYLFSDETLNSFCGSVGSSAEWPDIKSKLDAHIAASGGASDDRKPIKGFIYNDLKATLKLKQAGSNADAFAIRYLAPLIRPGTIDYDDLKRTIFQTRLATSH